MTVLLSMQVTHVYDAGHLFGQSSFFFGLLARQFASRHLRVFYSKTTTSRVGRTTFSCIGSSRLDYIVTGYFHTSQWSQLELLFISFSVTGFSSGFRTEEANCSLGFSSPLPPRRHTVLRLAHLRHPWPRPRDQPSYFGKGKGGLPRKARVADLWH
ncbi:hypothetical protein BGW80DRAFT_304383 [Lactifluus volemus]|nr:hypothetical protein BGW80DRAFT_304383 [Lactifluus volemus]